MATVALALGIGLTTVMFSIIYGLLLRGLPFEKSERIAMVMEASRGEPELALSMHDFVTYRDAQNVRLQSRRHYARPRAVVEREVQQIFRRL